MKLALGEIQEPADEKLYIWMTRTRPSKKDGPFGPWRPEFYRPMRDPGDLGFPFVQQCIRNRSAAFKRKNEDAIFVVDMAHLRKLETE